MDTSNLSEQLADIGIPWIAIFAFFLTVLRFGLVRIQSASARAFAEVIEAALIAVVLVFMMIQPFVMKSFYIPTPSMVPTLVTNDHIVVNKMGYRFEKPHRDDVVVFVAPPRAIELSPDSDPSDSGRINYIKRLIGLPGDVITTRHGFITVNGREEDHSDIGSAFNLDDRDNQHVKIESNDILIEDGSKSDHVNAGQIAQQFAAPGAPVTFHPGETIRNGQILDEPFTAEVPDYDFKIWDGHSVLDGPDVGGIEIDGMDATDEQISALRNAPSGAVPPNCVFVMGDNRNDSSDSTHWGPLEENRLVGDATFIFWPLDRIRKIR